MASQPTDPRPSMRRKSSASNLLMQSFKAGVAPSGMMNPVGGPPPIAIPSSAILYTAKDPDSLSTFSDATTAASFNPGQNNLEYLQNEIVRKRLVALTYLRNVHEGKAHWIGTLHLARADLERAFSNTSMKKRTTRFAVLAMSLSSTLESTTILDMLRSIIAILAEYDQFQDDNYKPRMRIPGFRSSKLRDATDAYLAIPNIPFALDYHQALLSFIDVLSELYYRLGNLLLQQAQYQQNSAQTPTPLTHPMSPPPTWSLPGPPLQPQHGVEYLRRPGLSPDEDEILKLAESAGGTARGGLFELGSPTGMAGAVWNSTIGELTLKMDGKFKKILGTLFKELDDLARQGIRDELASLDPLLRNVAMPSGGDDPYELYDI